MHVGHWKRMLVILAVTAFFVLPQPTRAQQRQSYVSQGFYRLTFLTDRRTVVYARIVIVNAGPALITQIPLEIRGANIQNLTIYQQALPKRCLYFYSFDSGYPCQSLANADINDYLEYPGGTLQAQYGDFKASYIQQTFTRTGMVYTIPLTLPVRESAATALVVSYIADGYAREPFPGLIQYSFPTFRLPAVLKKDRVAVDVNGDEGLYITDENSKQVMSRDSLFGFTNDYYPEASKLPRESMDALVAGIGKDAAHVRVSGAIRGNQEYDAKGEYARSGILLVYAPYVRYLNTILLFTAVLIAIVYVHYHSRRSRHYLHHKEETL